MSHRITATIGRNALILRLAERLGGSVTPTALCADLSIVPLGEEQVDLLTQLIPGVYREGFTYLSEGLERALVESTGAGALAYVETDYFGGRGTQAAAVIRDGEVAMRASRDLSRAHSGDHLPVNQALRMLGVTAAPDRDEFCTIGLGRYRSNEELGLADE